MYFQRQLTIIAISILNFMFLFFNTNYNIATPYKYFEAMLTMIIKGGYGKALKLPTEQLLILRALKLWTAGHGMPMTCMNTYLWNQPVYGCNV